MKRNDLFDSLISSLSDDNLIILKIIFRIFAIPIDKNDSIIWKIYCFIIILSMFIIIIGLIISTINKLNESLFNTISAIIFCTSGFLSYLSIIYTVSCGYNLINILKSMAASDRSTFGRTHDLRHTSEINNLLLKKYCQKWLSIACFISVISFSLLYVAYGSDADTHFLDVNDNNAWHIVNILFLHTNAGWLLPMVIVRVGTHFLERRIYWLIEYLECPSQPVCVTPESTQSCIVSRKVLSAVYALNTENYHHNQSISHSHSHSNSISISNINSNINILHIQNNNNNNNPSISITSASTNTTTLTGLPIPIGTDGVSLSDISISQVMCWYDDLYTLNTILSNALSPIIFQEILILFPMVVFILQGFLLYDISLRFAVAALYWFLTNSFILYIVTSSAARLDALNVRIEIAFASMPSAIMFSSVESVYQYRLALSKIRAIPLGINFFGLRKRISFQSMWTISSVFVSIFLLMLGYSI